jgi:hypothetical protein
MGQMAKEGGLLDLGLVVTRLRRPQRGWEIWKRLAVAVMVEKRMKVWL